MKHYKGKVVKHSVPFPTIESLSIGRFWCHLRQNTGGDWIDNGVLGVKFFT